VEALSYLAILFTAMLPAIEARGAYPLAYALGYTDVLTHILIFASSSLPAVPILYGLRLLEEKLVSRVQLLSSLYDKVIRRIRAKSERVVKYRAVYLGLALYVAIPLPGTGVWTGSLISYVVGLDRTKSLLAVVLGNFAACNILYALVVLIGLAL